jgi:hypothetical protein
MTVGGNVVERFEAIAKTVFSPDQCRRRLLWVKERWTRLLMQP